MFVFALATAQFAVGQSVKDIKTDVVYLIAWNKPFSQDAEAFLSLIDETITSDSVIIDTSRIGVVFCSGDAQVLVPLSNCRDSVLDKIRNTKRDTVTDVKTELGKGLFESFELLFPRNDDGKEHKKRLVLVTNGQFADTGDFVVELVDKLFKTEPTTEIFVAYYPNTPNEYFQGIPFLKKIASDKYHFVKMTKGKY